MCFAYCSLCNVQEDIFKLIFIEWKTPKRFYFYILNDTKKATFKTIHTGKDQASQCKFILHSNSLFLEFLPASMASIVARGKVTTRASEVEDRMSCSSEIISVFNGILEERSLGSGALQADATWNRFLSLWTQTNCYQALCRL